MEAVKAREAPVTCAVRPPRPHLDSVRSMLQGARDKSRSGSEQDHRHEQHYSQDLLSVALRQKVHLPDEELLANVPCSSRGGAMTAGFFRDTLRGSDRSQGLAVHLARSSLLHREPASKRFTLTAVKSPRSFKMKTTSLTKNTLQPPLLDSS